jgi:hypothetical protein
VDGPTNAPPRPSHSELPWRLSAANATEAVGARALMTASLIKARSAQVAPALSGASAVRTGCTSRCAGAGGGSLSPISNLPTAPLLVPSNGCSGCLLLRRRRRRNSSHKTTVASASSTAPAMLTDNTSTVTGTTWIPVANCCSVSGVSSDTAVTPQSANTLLDTTRTSAMVTP